MILADTSVWVDHFRFGDEDLSDLLRSRSILMHPFVLAELALGSLTQRTKTLTLLEQLPSAKVAHLPEVRHMIEQRSLFTRGIGLIDAHLVASALIDPRATLWTRDKRLRSVAEEIGVHADLA